MLYYSGSGHSSAETAAGKDAGTRMAQLQVGGPKSTSVQSDFYQEQLDQRLHSYKRAGPQQHI